MRQEGIPTSQQPTKQTKDAAGRTYEYPVPKEGGGTEIKSVQDQTMDRTHPGEPHWEAGSVKTDPETGAIRTNKHGRPQLKNGKSKVKYPPTQQQQPPPQLPQQPQPPVKKPDQA
jgi:hypothetical protein